MIIGIIISDSFINDLSRMLRDFKIIKSPYIRQIIKWCFDYHKKYKKAPKQHILDIFDLHKDTLRKKDDVKNIEDTFQHLIDHYFENAVSMENFNTDYFLDRARKYIKKRTMELLIIDLQNSLANDNLIEADYHIATYKPVQKNTNNGIDILKDTEKIIEILTTDTDKLFSFPGAMGEAWNDLYRGDLISLGAPQKRGKTWMMVYIAVTAVLNGLTVAYWTAEMKDRLMIKRIFQYLMGEVRTPYNEVKQLVTVPYFDEYDNIKYKKVDRYGMEISNIIKIQKNVKRQSRTGKFKLYDFSSEKGSIVDIDRQLETLSYFEEFHADVVLVDYFDILNRHQGASKDKMEALNEIWLYGKRIAQRRNLLMCTASQMQRKTYSEEAGVDHISDDIRKYGHVSHWCNLRQTPIEKDRQIMRVNVTGRHDDFKSDDVVALQCLSLGRPVIDSRWKSQIPEYANWLERGLESEEEEEEN
jgi:archaellum biogenesis ATPase FlaH